MDILALLQSLDLNVPRTTVRRLSRVISALLAISGRVTMRGLARWSGTGGSYRTIQRLFYTSLPWATLCWVLIKQQLWHAEATYILAGDEVVVTKAGKQTYGLDRFFSGLLSCMVPGLSFLALSLVNVNEGCAHPLRLEQQVRQSREAVAPPPAAQRKPGRPPGRKTGQRPLSLTPELQQLRAMLQAQQALLRAVVAVKHVALDGHFGNHNALAMVRACDLHLISKLRSDMRLYLPYTGPQRPRGARRKYGARLDPRCLPASGLQLTHREGSLETRHYQFQVWHREFPVRLNVVFVVKFNLATGQGAHVILFSDDLTLTAEQLVRYYSLRFQIEFNFRDAKQYWGLEDFMNITPTAVTNAANLAWFMVNISQVLLRPWRQTRSDASVLDLKALARGQRYVEELLKLLPHPPEAHLIDRWRQHVGRLGAVHVIVKEPAA